MKSSGLMHRFFASRARVDLPVVLSRKRIYILPTKFGTFFGFLLLALLIGSINYNNNLGFLLTFLLASMGFVSIFHTFMNLLGLEISRIDAGETFAPDPVMFTVHCRSASRVFRDIRIALRDGSPGGTGLRLEPGMSRTVGLAGPPVKRGIHPLPWIVLETFYPLGLFRAWSVLAVQGSVAVFPEPAGAVSLFSGNLPGDFGRDDGGGRQPGSDDFAGLREYVPGDPMQRIAWKASARGDDLLVRQFVTGSRRHVVLRWEDVTGSDEERLSKLCAMVLAADRRKVPYRLELPGHVLEVDQGAEHRNRCLRRLAEY